MPSATRDILIEQGVTFSQPITFMVPSSSADPTPIPMDLTAYTALSQIRDAFDSPQALATFTITFPPSGSATGSFESSGSLTMSLTAAQTAALPPLRGVYDLILIQQDVVIRVLMGDCLITPDVSRSS